MAMDTFAGYRGDNATSALRAPTLRSPSLADANSQCRLPANHPTRMQAQIWRNSRMIAENNLEAHAVRADLARAADIGWINYAEDRLADIAMHNRKLEHENGVLRRALEQSGIGEMRISA